MNKKLLISTIFILSLFLFLPKVVFTSENLEQICKIDKIEESCEVISQEKCRELLEKCEKYYQEESEKIEKDLNKTEAEKKTLQSKISGLNSQIRNLNYQISQSNLIIKDLRFQIGDTESSIGNTSIKIEESKEKLANILQTIYQEGQKPVIEVLLSENNLSSFFDNLMSLEILNAKSKEFLQNIKILKFNLENQKVSLDTEKGELERIVEIQTSKVSASSQTKKEQEYYFGLTEQEYQKQLKEKEDVDQKASEIRARIFQLMSVSDSEAPTFGEAYEIVKYVESITGVRPAFLLAILTQESNLGKNVGQCYLKNSTTGAGIVIRTGTSLAKVMRPGPPYSTTVDVPPFLEITKSVGRDPFTTPVSCPMSYGWGGAMGPAQFMPTTWSGYKSRLEEILGRSADPWSIRDAFLASGLYLSDYGAANRTYNGEFNAALSYFAGPGWARSSYKKVYERDYGYPVMKITSRYESDIEKIK